MPYDPISFVENAAQYSRYHLDHWFRYLRKIIKDGKIQLSSDQLDQIMQSDKLTPLQKVSLKRAAQPGTPTNLYIAGLNQRTNLTMLRQIMMRNGEKFC